MAIVWAVAVVMGLARMPWPDNPDSAPLGCVIALPAILVQALWVTIDCKRRGSPVG